MVTWGQQVLMLPWISLVLGLTWLCALGSQRFHVQYSPLVLGLILLLLMAAAQVVPLPEPLFRSIAPTAKFENLATERAAEFLSMEPTDAGLLELSRETGASHRCLSISPIQTRASMVGLTSAIILMICCNILFRDGAGKTLLLVTMGVVSTLVATVGIMQSISWNQWSLLGDTSHSGFATFVSRNSAPQYLAMGIGCTIAFAMLWLGKKRKQSRHSTRYRATNWVTRARYAAEDSFKGIDAVMILVAVAMVLQIGGVIGAASRGGFVALAFALFVTLMLTLGRSRRVQISGIAGAGLLAVLILSFANTMELDEEIYNRLEIERLDSPIRLEFWKLALGQSEFWLTGCGMGNFHFAIMQANVQHPYWIYHAESIFVEIISEFGILGLAVSCVGLFWLFSQLLKRQESRSAKLWPAVVYAVCAITLHSFVDFSLIIPAIFLSLSALVGAFHGELRQNSAIHAERSRSSLFLRNKIVVSIVFSALACLLWQGATPLAGFAQAERIESVHWDGQAQSVFASSIVPKTVDFGHPEVVLQLARQKGRALEEHLENTTRWPEDITAQNRKNFSRLEFAASIIRSADSQRWVSLQQQWNDDSRLLAALEAASNGYQFSTKHCLYDWRANWGQYQTETRQQKMIHALICARLQMLTQSMPSLQQAIGTCELLAGNPAIGMNYWKTCLANHPNQTFKLAPLVGSVLDFEQLVAIIPEGQIPKAVLCRSLVNRQETIEIGQRLLDQIDVSHAISEADTEFDWNVIVWLTKSREDSRDYILALRKLAILKPMDKAVRIQLAEALESIGEIEEAIQNVEQANRRATLSPSEEQLLRRLRHAQNAPP